MAELQFSDCWENIQEDLELREEERPTIALADSTWFLARASRRRCKEPEATKNLCKTLPDPKECTIWRTTTN